MAKKPTGPEEGLASALPEELVSDQTEIEAALYEEASQSDPGLAGAESTARLLDQEPPVTAEMEAAFLEEAYAAESPPDPVAETLAPTSDVTRGEYEQDQERAMFEPPPPEVDDILNGALPPRSSASLLDMDIEAVAGRDIQEPEEVIEPIELPDRELTEEEKAAVLGWLTDEQFKKLEKEIVEAYAEIQNTVAENETVANKGFNYLLKARDILLRRDAGKLSQAEYYIEQAKALLRRIAVSQAGARKYQWPILAWGILWAVAFLAALVLLGQESFAAIIMPNGTMSDNLINMHVLIPSMIWGGIGGAVAIIYSLFKHIGARDFDPHYGVSYFGKPFLGAIIGATAYIILNLLIRVLGIFPAGLESGDGATAPTVAPAVIYVVAWAGGFKENQILELIDRVMKRIFAGTEG